MSRYSVNTVRLKSAASRCSDISESIGNLARDINDVKHSLDNDMGRYSGVIFALNNCVQNASKCKTNVSWYGIYGNSIADKYDQAENTVIGNIITGKFDSVQLGGSSGVISESANTFPIGEMIKEAIFGGTGTIGTIAGGVADLVQGNPGDFMSSLYSAMGDLWRLADNVEIRWGDLIGLGEAFDAGSVAGNYFDFSTVSKGLGSLCSWAAEIISSGVVNYEEFADQGRFSNARFYQETLLEAAIAIGEGVAIGAGVAAVAGLMGVSLPAVAGFAAVGAITVAVDWLGDFAARNLTGNPDAEWKDCVGDFIIDTHDKVVEVAADAAEAVVDSAVDVVKNVGNVIGETVGSICKWGSLFGG